MAGIITSKKSTKTKQGSTKIDPSFKSKRYRDKLRTEVKALEGLIPVDRPALHRKLDSQTVYRLVIAFLRIKNYFKPINQDGGHLLQANEVREDKSELTPAAVQCKKMESKILKQINLNELLEGFIIMLSVDGTIMYVSENVVNFNGFNQVDLIHRCIYGIIHPDDQLDVKNILEKNGHNGCNQYMGMAAIRKKPKLKAHENDSTTASFFCRMKCFIGNTAGYMKLHCSGKLQTIPNVPRSTKMSDRIAIFFCQPFIYNGNDVMNESKDNVFWSKHDLDLTFKETERKVTDILGYEENELCDMSMYQLVHPEDLHTLVTVHKTITEVSDVQSFFMRLKHKHDTWRWLHSKGKVISKNSKKFSIVFTHSPIRDDNSAFLQQEILLRRKHSLKDLIHMATIQMLNRDHVVDTGDFCITEKKCRTYSYPGVDVNHTSRRPYLTELKRGKVEPSEYFRECCENPNEEVSVILNPLTFVPLHCPSSWHSNSDRHSPVVPSSHVAHKLCLKEKQLQYAQFKRSHQPFHRDQKTDSCYGIPNHCDEQLYYSNNGQQISQTIGRRSNRDPYNNLYEQSVYLYNVGPVSDPRYVHYSVQPPMDSPQIYLTSCNPPELYNYPPSPPPSPRRLPAGNSHFNNNQHCVYDDDGYLQTNGYLPRHIPDSVEHMNNEKYSVIETQSIPRPYPNWYGTSSTSSCNCVLPDAKSHPSNYQFKSHANIRFSMVFNSSPSTNDQLRTITQKLADNPSQGKGNSMQRCLPCDKNEATRSANHMKTEPETGLSCSIGTDSMPINSTSDCIQYDVEASIHMKIVETEKKTSPPCYEVEIPTFDSFMDFLTDEKIY